MGWVVAPTQHAVGICTVRLVNGQINPSTTATIGVNGDTTADFQLAAGWPPQEILPAGIDITDVVQVTLQPGGVASAFRANKSITANGTLQISIVNNSASPIVFSDIYLRYLHSMIR